MRKKNRTVKQVLKYLVEDKLISEGEYNRIWNDYKQTHKVLTKRIKEDD